MEILQDRALISISGSDTVKFLQGLTTKNITTSENLIYSLMLTPQGKYLYEIFLYKHNDGFIAEIYFPHKDSFLTKMKMFKLRSQVEFKDITEDYRVVFSDDKLDFSPFCFADPRHKKLGFRSIIKKSDLSFIESSHQSNFYLKKKYDLAIPDYLDFTQDKSFPLEYGLDYLNAIDFDKGCYIGQEPISRTKHRGVIRKNIYKVEAKKDFKEILDKNYSTSTSTSQSEIEDEEENPSSIKANNKNIGKILSFYGNKAIALIRDEELQNALDNNLPLEVNNASIIALKPLWRS